MLIGDIVGLRAIERNDLLYLLKWRNNVELRQFFREYRELSSENQEIWFNKHILNAHDIIMFSIIDLGNEELIGACGLNYINWIDRNAEISIYIGKNDLYIDDIFAIDATKLVIKYAFNEINLHRLWVEVYHFDDKKKRLFELLNFKMEGEHRETHWTKGYWCSSIFYSLLDKEYFKELE